jgi:hypothetical protein
MSYPKIFSVTNSQKIEALIALAIYLGSKWFVRVLMYMFGAIAIHLFLRWTGLSLPPYF